MTDGLSGRRFDRRHFLKVSSLGALTVAGSGALVALGRGEASHAALAPPTPAVKMRLAATDGKIHLPGRDLRPGEYGVPGEKNLMTFGFREVKVADFSSLVPPPAFAADVPIYDLTAAYKGHVTATAPHIALREGETFHLTLTNLGFIARPDLDDSHTVHWHGFRQPVALFDGVPEVSIAVPVYRDFTYFYRAGTALDGLAGPGTYFYHCHFEDTEHVQMRMTGMVWIRPAQDGDSHGGFTRFAYNDAVAPGNLAGSTGYEREFPLLLAEVDERPPDNLERIQEFVWSDYEPQYWIINGRAYPDTVYPNNPPAGHKLDSQPNSSLIQVNPGDRALIRLGNLGFEQHAMQLPGIPMKVVGEDATLLRGPGGADLSYGATTIYIGPGESRDVLFTAPAYSASAEGGTDLAGDYNRYYLRNRNLNKLTNNGTADPATGLGGMVTEVRVYDGSPLGDQTVPGQTYPA